MLELTFMNMIAQEEKSIIEFLCWCVRCIKLKQAKENIFSI